MSLGSSLLDREPLHLLFDALDGHASSRGSRVAIVGPDRRCRWQELSRNVSRIAATLADAGLESGERCAILAGQSTAHVELMFAVARAGGVVTQLSLMLNEVTLVRLLRDCEPRFLFLDAIGRQRLPAVDFVPSILDVEEIVGGERTATNTRCPLPLPGERDPFSIIYSSGTTGVPKGIVHSHRARALYGAVFAQEYRLSTRSVALLTTPLYSNASWMMVLSTLFAGGQLVLADGFSPGAFYFAVAEHGVTHAFLVPAQIQQLFAHGLPPVGSFPEVLISGGSPLDASLKLRLVEEAGVELYELYGNTEGVCTLLRPWSIAVAPDSVGNALTTEEIRVISDDGEELPVGASGEIVGRGPLMSDGYFRCDEQNEALTWTDRTGRRFVRSGDLGVIGEDGMLRLRGRKKDMLLSGGLNVYPIDIERTLREHPEVRDAAVIGIPDARWGETPFAFVTLSPRSKLSSDDLVAWANERLNKHQRIRGAQIVESLPRNALGKVVKGDLEKRIPGGRT